MCVILTAEKKRVTDAMIETAADVNPHGNGFAWIVGPSVRFEKNITIARAQKLAASVPLPYVFHARIASIGKVCPELCHPFPLDRRGARTRLQGTSPKGVLFHNGTWFEWKDYIDADPGPWSDSVAMSVIAGDFGFDVLVETVPDSQRIALLTPKGLRRLGAGWSALQAGVYASNRYGFERVARPDACQVAFAGARRGR